MIANLVIVSIGILYRWIAFQLVIIPDLVWVVNLHIRDTIYLILNAFLPLRKRGRVIAFGKPGYNGVWPPFREPGPGDSRSPCPGLNALANHGILPHNGKQIGFKQVSQAIQDAYNFSPSLGDQTTASAYTLNNNRGYFDLSDLNAQNVVQHDASFFRNDVAFEPTQQAVPHPWLVERFLDASSDGKRMTVQDMAYYNGLRRTECKKNNGQYSLGLSFLHKIFGSGNAAFLWDIFGGDVADLRIWLTQERIPDGWEPKNRNAYGHTIICAQKTTLDIEFRTWEGGSLRPGDVLEKAENAYKKGKKKVQRFADELDDKVDFTNLHAD